MRSRIVQLFGASALALGLFATSAHAQQAARSGTQGLLLGLHLNGSSLTIDDTDADTESGGGLALQLGYNFTPSLGIFLAGSAASMSDASGADAGYTFGAGDLGVRYTFANPARAFVPYVDAAFTAINATSDEEAVELRGTGFSLGAGVQYFVSPRLAVDGKFRYTMGSFDELVIDGESFSDDEGLDVTSGRVNLGVKFYPMAR